MSRSVFKQCLAVLIVCYVAVLLSSAAFAEERIPENTITVQGIGAVTVQPDSVRVQLGVEEEARTVEAARNQNANKMARITQRLRALGIPNLKLQTAGFSVYPIREPAPPVTPLERRRAERIVGYRVSNILTVRIEGGDPGTLAVDAGRVIDTALGAGANSASGIDFYLSQEQRAQQEALQLAVRQARQNAEAVAQAASVTLSGIFNIEAYSQPIAMRQFAVMEARADEAARAPTPVEPGELDVTANVTVRFDIRE